MRRRRNEVLVSIATPFHNEEANLAPFFFRVEKALADAGVEDYEIVCVDDGSTDGTLAGLIHHSMRNPRIRVVSLSRNFGKDVALTAALDHTRGDVVVPMDADLQDPPELIGEMLQKWREGYDVVHARRAKRDSDTFMKRLTARLFYRVHNLIADVPIPDDTGDFRLMDRKVVEAIRRLPERTRFMKGLFAWVGFRQTSVEYEREPRVGGETKWNYWKLWNFALDGITASSTLPLRVWTYLGFGISALAFLYGGWLVVRTLAMGVDVPGYASMMAAILFLGGLNIIATGILGEYIARIHNEVRQRPLYIVRERHGFAPPEAEAAGAHDADDHGEVVPLARAALEKRGGGPAS